MRPLRLTMRAIGPFLEKTVVDFDRIGAQSLFLVHGQTGRGKSFIFDAMTYALYAETPAGRENHLRSDFAESTVKPVVEFVFQLRDKTYKVTRELAYERPKLRGSGTTQESDSQHLCELTGWPHGSETTLASKKRDVDTKIAELIGLDRAQFQQVMLLPQGEFRRLLLASSMEREAVLETLFDASFFQRIQDQIERTCRAERKQNERLTQAIALFAGQAREKLPPDLQPASDEAPSEELILAGIDRLAGMIGAEIETVAEKNAALQKANAAKQEAEQLLADHRQKTTLEETLANIETRRPAMDALAAERRQADAAEALRPKLDAQTRAAEQHTQALKRADSARADLLGKQTARKEAAESAKAAPGLRNQAQTKRQQLALLEPLVNTSKELTELRKQLAGARQAEEAARKAHETATQALAKGRKELLAREEEERTVQAQRVDTVPLVRREDGLKRAADLGKRVAALRKNRNSAEGAQQHAQALETKAETTLLELRAAREGNLAGELAVTLEPGKPCPVCGSTEHPQKAVPQETAPTKKALADADLALAEQRSANTKAQQALATAQTRLDEGETALAGLLSELGVALGAVEAELKTVTASLAAESARAAREAKLVSELRRLRETAIPKWETDERAALEARNTAATAAESANSRLEQVEQHWRQALDQGVRGALGEIAESATPAQIEACIAGFRTDALKLDQQAALLEETAVKAEKAEAGAQATVDERGKAVVQSADERDKATVAFSEALAESAFESIEAFRAALRETAWRETSKAKLEDFAVRARDARVRLEETTKRIAEREPPELDGFQAASEAARREYEEAHGRQLELEQRRADLRRFLASIRELKDESGDIIDRLRVLGRLDRELRGQAQPRISLKRFFLAQRLDEVLIQASRRMHLLSNGRFTLKRAPGGQTQREQTGLDLLVTDSYTGTERPVNTLSGGQLFLASLSMALGLADVVQARSGGTRMDTLFIDEGFGSLDEETLQLAMKVLNELRAGRMVGVISHVSELKDQIGSRIEVFEADVGSRLRLTIDE